MADHKDRIDQLNQKLETLLGKQENFAQELMALYKEIEVLKKLPTDQFTATKPTEPIAVEALEPVIKVEEPKIPEPEIKAIVEKRRQEAAIVEQKTEQPVSNTKKPKGKSSLEKFIGENLINKIGIAITVIGVAIGAKYSIENNLISPLTRIILGYLVGLGLVAFGFKLKAKYESYSAVLVSGALAILYLITFLAYSLYGLFPQLMAFGLMLLFTVFGVVAALNYNKVVIAHIGLVGAYAVPFLLSNDSGNTLALFSYMAIINVGILVIAVRRFWKSLYYASFVFTWLIYGAWNIFSYDYDTDFTLATIFLTIFFVIFYVTFLVYKLIKSEQFLKSDVVLVLLNSFIFYGLGFALLSEHDTGGDYLGIFTLCNAIIHFVVSAVLFRKKLVDRNLFYLISGLVLVFITMAIPVQLDGNWVTLLWAFEAAVLFWIGRTKKVAFYERISYVLMVLGFFSLLEDWEVAYGIYSNQGHFDSILNIVFASSLLFVAAFGFINWIHLKTKPTIEENKTDGLTQLMNFALPAIFLLALFGAVYVEIEYYFEKAYQNSQIQMGGVDSYHEFNYSLIDFGEVWQLNFTMFFIAILAFMNIAKIKNRVFGVSTLVLQLMSTLIFLGLGLFALSELREAYLLQDVDGYFEIGQFYIGIRYVAIAFFAVLLFSIHKLTRAAFMKVNFKIPFEMLLHTSILWIISSELLNWMDIAGSDQSYKLGLSILWGVYSLLLIGLGIWKTKKYLRIAGIALFGITLVKLFIYDIASLDTISKTIVFVSLGVLLLIISFLYNKYKPATDEHED